ncbi:hypothetical protein F4820DRAFT_363139 [Hypoxylon rubiginosum]|uniref:Uncharacterized protein n=1 Tax=Hypoxylon rubiginosum TaxID=110542 RepID=A0ACB9YWB9_9PEZI|nr:hypothetical protein F4820DRAFT_363139 [Hypoxylon rubiginosum]
MYARYVLWSALSYRRSSTYRYGEVPTGLVISLHSIIPTCYLLTHITEREKTIAQVTAAKAVVSIIFITTTMIHDGDS